MVNFKKIASIFFNFLTLKKNKIYFKLFLTTFVCGFHFMIGFTQKNDSLYYKLEFRKAYPFKNKDDVARVRSPRQGLHLRVAPTRSGRWLL